MTLDTWDTLSSVVEHVATVLALLVGGSWVLYRFVLGRETAWNLVIDADPTFHAYAKNLVLLTVYITISNIGKIKVRPSIEGCWFSLRVIPADLKVGDRPHWNEGQPLVERLDVIRHGNPDHDLEPMTENYTIEPGAKVVEVVNVLVPCRAVLMAEVAFFASPSKDQEGVWTYRVWGTPEELNRTGTQKVSG